MSLVKIKEITIFNLIISQRKISKNPVTLYQNEIQMEPEAMRSIKGQRIQAKTLKQRSQLKTENARLAMKRIEGKGLKTHP